MARKKKTKKQVGKAKFMRWCFASGACSGGGKKKVKMNKPKFSKVISGSSIGGKKKTRGKFQSKSNDKTVPKSTRKLLRSAAKDPSLIRLRDNSKDKQRNKLLGQSRSAYKRNSGREFKKFQKATARGFKMEKKKGRKNSKFRDIYVNELPF